MADRTDLSSLQVIERSQLDIIYNKTEYSGTVDNKQSNTSPLKSLLSGINSELKIPYLMSESAVADLTVNISSDLVQNTQTSRQKTHNQTNNSFSGGTVVFPAADSGTITVSPGSNSVLSCAPGFFIKALIQIDSSGQISVKQSAQNASLSAITPPSADGQNLPIGYVEIQNISGTIQNISNNNIYQYINSIKNLSLSVQEIDGSPLVNEVVKIKFPNNSVTDDGNGVVTVNLGSSGQVVNDLGDSIIKLKPSITDFVLQAPDTTKWQFTVGDDGLIIATSGTSNPVTNLKILRDDGVEVSFRVDNTGLLQVVDPPDAGTTLVSNIFLESPSGVAHELKVAPTVNNFILQSPDLTKWEISIDDSGSLVSTSGAVGTVRNIKLRRDDLTEIGITIDNSGNLQTQNPPQVGAILSPSIFLQSPNSTIWDLKINNLDQIYTTDTTTSTVVNKSVIYTSTEITINNKLQVQDDEGSPLFSVREFEKIDPTDILRKGAFIEMPVLTKAQLNAIEIPTPSSPNVIIEVYLRNPSLFGNAPRKVFFDPDDNEWKYIHDPTILVFP